MNGGPVAERADQRRDIRRGSDLSRRRSPTRSERRGSRARSRDTRQRRPSNGRATANTRRRSEAPALSAVARPTEDAERFAFRDPARLSFADSLAAERVKGRAGQSEPSVSEGQAALESFTPRMQTRIRDQYRLGAPASGEADRIDGSGFRATMAASALSEEISERQAGALAVLAGLSDDTLGNCSPPRAVSRSSATTHPPRPDRDRSRLARPVTGTPSRAGRRRLDTWRRSRMSYPKTAGPADRRAAGSSVGEGVSVVPAYKQLEAKTRIADLTLGQWVGRGGRGAVRAGGHRVAEAVRHVREPRARGLPGRDPGHDRARRVGRGVRRLAAGSRGVAVVAGRWSLRRRAGKRGARLSDNRRGASSAASREATSIELQRLWESPANGRPTWS